MDVEVSCELETNYSVPSESLVVGLYPQKMEAGTSPKDILFVVLSLSGGPVCLLLMNLRFNISYLTIQSPRVKSDVQS